MLQRAAVIGEVFWWGAVADLSPPEEVGRGRRPPPGARPQGSDQARRAHVRRRGRLPLRPHPDPRRRYDSMPKRSRAELHERFAGWADDHAARAPSSTRSSATTTSRRTASGSSSAPRGDEEDRARRAERPTGSCGQVGAPSAAATFTQRATLLERAGALLAPRDVRRLDLAPELGLVLTTSGALSRAEEVLTEVIEHGDGVPQSVVLAARIERVLLRSRSDPRGDWEEDLALIEVALPGLESAADLDRRGHRAVARGWFLIGLVRGLLGAGMSGPGRTRCSVRGTTRSWRAIAGRRRRSSAGSASRPGQGRCRFTTASGSASSLLELGAGRPLRWRRAAAAGSVASSRGRAGSRRRVSSSPRRPPPTRSSERGSTPSQRRRSAARTSSCLRVTPRRPSRALREGYEALGNLGEIGHLCLGRGDARPHPARPRSRRRSGRARPRGGGDCVRARSLRRRRCYRLTRARLLVDAGALDEAERVARDALAIVEPTDLLDLHGDVLLELAVVLRSADSRRRGARVRRARGRALRGEGEHRRRRPRPRAARGHGDNGRGRAGPPSPRRRGRGGAAGHRASAPAATRAPRARATASVPPRRPGSDRSMRGRRPARAPADRAPRARPPAPAARAGRGRGSSRASRSRPTCQSTSPAVGSGRKACRRKPVASQLCQPRAPGSTPRSATRQSSVRDGGQHARLEPLLTRAPHRLVRGLDEHARVAVENGADLLAGANRPRGSPRPSPRR